MPNTETHTIIEASVSACTGDVQKIQIHITQGRPYPNIDRWDWRNLETLEPSPYRNAQGTRLPDSYSFTVLRHDFDPEQHDPTTLTSHAGYRDNSPALEYRREPLGEVSGIIDAYGRALWLLDGLDVEYGTARVKWLTEQLEPQLLAAIETHHKQLRDECVTNIAERFASEIRKGREALERLEQEAAAILKGLD